MSAPETRPVVIAGAGPTGLVLAISLAKNGVPVRIIEKDAQHHVGQRGAGLMPRTLEVYRMLGVADDIMKIGAPFPHHCVYEWPEGRKVVKTFEMLPWADPTPTVPYRSPWMIGQARNEAILCLHLETLGVHVELDTELVGFEQNESNVSAHIVKRNGSSEVHETVEASYLVGADGARSVVRKQLGLDFPGETRDKDRVLIADIEVRGLARECWHSWGDGGKTVVQARPTEDNGVFSFLVDGPDLDYQSLVDDHQALLNHIRKITNRNELEFGQVRWVTEWRPNIRMTNKFSKGRIFIAGDAGHVHAPTGGQGLNTSVQDAFNLAWKLALVHKGLAAPSLLETYDTERLPVITEMIARSTAILNQTTSFRPNERRSRIFHQLGVNCRWSPILVDEQPEADSVKTAGPYLDEDPTVLYAGDRAPEAPGLVKLTQDGSASDTKADVKQAETTSLLNVYGPTHHTVLIFATEPSEVASLLRAVGEYPASLITRVVVLPKDTSLTASISGAEFTVVDSEGHAREIYPPVDKGFRIIVVRPDGVVGAVAKGGDGLKRYFNTVFYKSI